MSLLHQHRYYTEGKIKHFYAIKMYNLNRNCGKWKENRRQSSERNWNFLASNTAPKKLRLLFFFRKKKKSK